MSEGVQLVLIPGAVSLVVAVVGYFGIRYTARQSARAQVKTAEIEEDKVLAIARADARAGYQELVADLRKEISGVREAQTEDRRAHQEQLAEIEERHRRQIFELREERRIHDTLLNARLDELEKQHTSDHRRIAALDTYIRTLLRLLRGHAIVPPPAPPGMHFDD